MGKRIRSEKSPVISASEISQFTYCSYAWQLRRLGYEPESSYLQSGRQAHIVLGEQIESLEIMMRISRWCAMIGIVMLCIALFLFFFEVIL